MVEDGNVIGVTDLITITFLSANILLRESFGGISSSQTYCYSGRTRGGPGVRTHGQYTINMLLGTLR